MKHYTRNDHVNKGALTESEIVAIERNLFPSAQAIVRNRPEFPWHRDRSGAVTASRVESSQALALDVFETIRGLDARDVIVAAWVNHLRLPLPVDGTWTVDIEHVVDRGLLGELRPTQLDALLRAPGALIVCECKFTEGDGGTCSQTGPISSGSHAGLAQCNGRYELQRNPVNDLRARCALTAKGIRYWATIPEVLGFNADLDHSPCPVAGGWYQWMRNLVVAREL